MLLQRLHSAHHEAAHAVVGAYFVWVDRNEPKADIINDTKALLSSSPAQKGLKNCCEKHSLQLSFQY